MERKHDILTLRCKVKAETDKAYLIEADMGEAWFPKSQVEVERDADGYGTDEAQIPEWLAIDKGII